MKTYMHLYENLEYNSINIYQSEILEKRTVEKSETHFVFGIFSVMDFMTIEGM
jgi:hypothetical protein